MTYVIVKIMTEVLSILTITTKEIKQGRSSESIDIQKSHFAYLFLETFFKKLFGKKEVEDALKKLDALTMEEARMAIVETLKVTNRVDIKVDKVDDKVDKLDETVNRWTTKSTRWTTKSKRWMTKLTRWTTRSTGWMIK